MYILDRDCLVEAVFFLLDLDLPKCGGGWAQAFALAEFGLQMGLGDCERDLSHRLLLGAGENERDRLVPERSRERDLSGERSCPGILGGNNDLTPIT